MITFKEKENFSLLLLAPFIFKDINEINKYIVCDDSFVNGYSVDINNPSLSRNLLLLFNADKKMSDDKNLTENDSYLCKKRYIIQGVHYVSIVYSIDFEYEKDFCLILDGDYTNISDESKNIISLFWNNTSRSEKVNNIIYKKFKYYAAIEDSIPEEDLLYSYSELI